MQLLATFGFVIILYYYPIIAIFTSNEKIIAEAPSALRCICRFSCNSSPINCYLFSSGLALLLTLKQGFNSLYSYSPNFFGILVCGLPPC
jgi:hypothetical protein